MTRRELIALLGGTAAAWPMAAHAQRMRRIGVFMNSDATDPVYRSYVATFVATMRSLGWRDGQNLRIDVRWSAGDAERIRPYAAELVGMTPDLILSSSTANLAALIRVTRSIPIVFVQVSDPVAQGFVSSLAHPGGNVTGFSSWESSMGGKWLNLLQQMVSGLARVAVMFNPGTSPQTTLFLPSIQAAAQSFAVEVVATPVHESTEIEPAIASFSRQPNGGVIFSPDSFLDVHDDLILELMARYRLPAIYASPAFRNSGLIYYALDWASQFRQAAIYIDRILKGTPPGDLPVQLPTKFELIINVGAARAIGVEVPMGLLLNADEVIE